VTIWILLRAAGIGAYVALWLAVVWGLVATTGIVKKRISKPSANSFHAFVATTGLVLLGVHLTLLLIDTYMPFAAPDVLIPMHSTFRPWAITAGVLAMYGMVMLIVSSWSRSKLSTRVWRAIHLLSVPAFVLALLHGVFAGTDTERPWMFVLYATTGVITFFLVVVRGLTADYRPPRPAPPVRAGVEPVSAKTRLSG
jgi:DMSO/TMAO reductase YedYZ heme-binding membrane subunit